MRRRRRTMMDGPEEWTAIRVGLLLVVALSSLPQASVTTTSPSPAAFTEICAGSRPPVMLGEATLGFCGNNGVSCCDAVDDAALGKEFEAMMNVSNRPVDAACATIVKAILCAKCSPSLSDGSFKMNASSTTITDPSSLSLLCAAPPLTNSSHYPNTSGSPQEDTMCLEKIAEGSYLNMAAHPDGSERIFLSTQEGMIWLASVPAHGSQGAMEISDGTVPFLDLRDRVSGLRLLGIAFHPKFATNGRFFVSYHISHSSSTQTCGADRHSDGSAAAPTNGSRPCRYQLVISEFSAKDGVSDSQVAHADPSEKRRIFTMDLTRQPHSSYQRHGGQILFRPSEGYLYLITGHGGEEVNDFDFPENKKSFLGKVIRFDVNHLPGETGENSSRDGSGSSFNMFTPEIFATGLSNPNGCSFDSETPSNFYCANVNNQGQSEELLSISQGGNYSGSSGQALLPIVTYGPPMVGRTPTIVGGLVYHGSADPSLEGRYLYMYGSAAWTAKEKPVSSGRYATARIPNIKCSRTTPIACRHGGISGRVLSMGEDNLRDSFVLATGGVYRVVQPGLCDAPSEPQRSSAWVLWFLGSAMVLAIFTVCSNLLCGQGQALANCHEWYGCSIICCLNVRNMINGPIASHGEIEAAV